MQRFGDATSDLGAPEAAPGFGDLHPIELWGALSAGALVSGDLESSELRIAYLLLLGNIREYTLL